MSETTTLNIRVNKDLKKQSDMILSLLGLNTSTAVNMFLNAVVRNNGIPFSLTLNPNNETKQALDDVIAGKNLSKTFDNVKDLMDDLNA
ncbi:type II toxin-antitoxin system RelB/DinJ family antitoxin [Megamonas funiformis]|uniref:type II toxin-antitoxin system RelB/DinJ family antitoxin n=1 Tax=Megamonas funiformis TaxID=437897 RepID=UPI000E505DF0|nr:type II toxin-antitoxin system RelB/DinJ family antitoxin [Megamonas funiformis]RHG09804.1 type II toxin-antitoxin system RelB/DinJ family antitoxin [Megamonas funiformis]